MRLLMSILWCSLIIVRIMGIFDEVRLAKRAEKLEKIIVEAINDSNWRSMQRTIEQLVSWYYWEVSDTYGGHKIHPAIEETFPPKKYM